MKKRGLRVACLQMNAGDDPEKNFKRFVRRCAQLSGIRPDVIALPESFAYRGDPARAAAVAQTSVPRWIDFCVSSSRREETAFLLGGFPEPAGQAGFFNTSLWIDRGRVTARYRKTHLFEIFLPGKHIREAAHAVPGKRAVSVSIRGIRAGLSICYDLRFPEYFRTLAVGGCRVAFVPSNFTAETGRAHWEILLRSRAIENQMFIVAPAQTGANPHDGVQSYGNSMIVDPWGRVLAKASVNGEATLCADLDFSMQDQVRKRLPALKHIRFRRF